MKHVEEGEMVNHYVLTKGDSLKKEVDCRIDFVVDNPGRWSVSGANSENFSLSAGGKHQNTYTAINNGATSA